MSHSSGFIHVGFRRYLYRAFHTFPFEMDCLAWAWAWTWILFFASNICRVFYGKFFFIQNDPNQEINRFRFDELHLIALNFFLE